MRGERRNARDFVSGKIFPAWSRKMVGVRNCVEIRMKWGLLVEESRNRHDEVFLAG